MRRNRIVAPLAALLLAAIMAGPMIWIVITSFKTFVQSQAVPPVWPSLTNVSNYIEQFSGPQSALPPLLHSLLVATATMVITTLVAIPAAYALARYDIPHKKRYSIFGFSVRASCRSLRARFR